MAGETRPKVVVVEVGLGGLWAALTLTRESFDVWLVDRNNYHTFLPLPISEPLNKEC